MKLVKAICILAYVLCLNSASAQVTFNSVWEASTGKFPDEVCPPWTLIKLNNPPPPTLEGDTLVIATTSFIHAVWYGQFEPQLDSEVPLVMETRLKIVSGSAVTPSRGPYFLVWRRVVGTQGVLSIGIDKLILWSGIDIVGSQSIVDTDSEFHNYRVEVTPTNQISVFYDDSLVLTGEDFILPGVPPIIAFGDTGGHELGTIKIQSFKHNAYAPIGDDNTSSIGKFRILVDQPFRSLMTDYPGYDNVSKLTSPLLFDPATVIGRSAPHGDGDAADVAGTAVGTAGTIVSDGDFTLVPDGFQGPAGTQEVHTEIRSLKMAHALGVALRAGDQAPMRPISPGEVESHDSTAIGCVNFPAQSFFNVFVEVDMPAGGNFPFPSGTLYNQVPLLVRADTIHSFPPKVVYVHDNAEAVRMFFKSPDPGARL